MQLHLDNSVALVVGGASGIGRACVDGFLAEGARVAIWDQTPMDLAVADPDRCSAIQVDISDLDAVERSAADTESRFGAVDHLVHAAAIGSGKYGVPFTRLEPADWTRILEVNISGMVNVAHTLAPRMVSRGSYTYY